MTSRVVDTEAKRELAVRFIKELPMPFTMETQKGRRRSSEQNRTQFLWFTEIAEQTGQTVEEARAYCKLHIGVPILRAENEIFRVEYDEVIRPMAYETKMRLMGGAFDFSVTRRMTVAQAQQYLDGIQKFAAEQGIILTSPEQVAA